MRARFFAVAAAISALAAGCGGTADTDAGPVERVLVVSLPGVGWRDVEPELMPNLDHLVGEAAVGNLATRVGRRAAGTADAYLTMGAGTRAVAPTVEAGLAVGDGEHLGAIDGADLLERRLGEVPDGIVYLAAGPAIDGNQATVYGADVGLLGDELQDHGVTRAVVANADAVDELVAIGATAEPATYERSAVALLMGSDGVVPGGRVDADLLVDDPTSPFGVRLDPDATAQAAAAGWRAGDRSVVLVEASDLHRVAAYGRRATGAERQAMRRRALADADALFGRLLAMADPSTDAVLVVGVPAAPGQPDLGVAALRAPGAGTGLLRSATTGRDGYVQLADLMPTVLHLLGESYPHKVEGRPFAVAGSGGDRVRGLARDAREAALRDQLVPAVTVAFIAVLAALLACSGPWRWSRARRWPARPVVAYGILGAAAATFVAGASWASPGSAPAYAAAVVVLGALLGVLAWAAERRWRRSGPVIAVGILLAVIGVDVASGASLQLNTVFGYSVAVAGRFAGLGNLAFALFSAGAVILAVLLADRYGPAGTRAGIAVLVAAVVIDGFPLLGADVGGSLAMVPAFGVTAIVLLGWRLRWVHLAGLAALAVTVTLLFAFVDLARPEQSETHLARFARQLLDGRWTTLSDNLGRRFQASFGGLEPLSWGLVVAVAAAAGIYVTLVGRGRIPLAERRATWPRPVVAAVGGLGVLALLGWTTNDSSFAVPATMLIVVVPVLVDHLLRGEVATP